MITQERIIPRPLSADALAAIGSTAEVCDILRAWGRPDLAARIAWFASDADLDEGDVPLTLESALGFLAFFGTVDSPDGKVDLGCAPEGWLCAVWRFPDLRRVSLWFMNSDTVMYAARKSAGHFADLNNGSEVGRPRLDHGTTAGNGGMVLLAQRQPGRRELAPTHHVARYCRPRDIGMDGQLIETAFTPRPGEAYLSANWLEHFHDSDRAAQIAGVRRALTAKGFQLRRAARFAVLNVGDAVATCRAGCPDANIRIVLPGRNP